MVASGTALLLLTRDLRVHDHPALVAAARAERLIVVFAFDPGILARPYAAPRCDGLRITMPRSAS